MSSDTPRSPVYKVIGFAGAGLIVVLAVALVIVYGPALKHESRAAALASALATHLPDSDPSISGAGSEELRITLTVEFDPTVDAEQAHNAFRRALTVAEGQNLASVKTVEVCLEGANLEGRSTSASRTFDYEPASGR